MRTFGAIYPWPQDPPQVHSVWLDMWLYRIRERITPRRPRWLHVLMCPYCRGMAAYVKQQQNERKVP